MSIFFSLIAGIYRKSLISNCALHLISPRLLHFWITNVVPACLFLLSILMSLFSLLIFPFVRSHFCDFSTSLSFCRSLRLCLLCLSLLWSILASPSSLLVLTFVCLYTSGVSPFVYPYISVVPACLSFCLSSYHCRPCLFLFSSTSPMSLLSFCLSWYLSSSSHLPKSDGASRTLFFRCLLFSSFCFSYCPFASHCLSPTRP